MRESLAHFYAAFAIQPRLLKPINEVTIIFYCNFLYSFFLNVLRVRIRKNINLYIFRYVDDSMVEGDRYCYLAFTRCHTKTR